MTTHTCRYAVRDGFPHPDWIPACTKTHRGSTTRAVALELCSIVFNPPPCCAAHTTQHYVRTQVITRQDSLQTANLAHSQPFDALVQRMRNLNSNRKLLVINASCKPTACLCNCQPQCIYEPVSATCNTTAENSDTPPECPGCSCACKPLRQSCESKGQATPAATYDSTCQHG